MAKITYRIPTEQYAYVEVEMDTDKVDVQEIRYNYEEMVNGFKPQVGLTAKDFNLCIDKYMATGTLNGGTELYYQMNDKQKFFFQELKKHNKRANYKTDEQE